MPENQPLCYVLEKAGDVLLLPERRVIVIATESEDDSGEKKPNRIVLFDEDAVDLIPITITSQWSLTIYILSTKSTSGTTETIDIGEDLDESESLGSSDSASDQPASPLLQPVDSPKALLISKKQSVASPQLKDQTSRDEEKNEYVFDDFCVRDDDFDDGLQEGSPDSAMDERSPSTIKRKAPPLQTSNKEPKPNPFVLGESLEGDGDETDLDGDETDFDGDVADLPDDIEVS